MNLVDNELHYALLLYRAMNTSDVSVLGKCGEEMFKLAEVNHDCHDHFLSVDGQRALVARAGEIADGE